MSDLCGIMTENGPCTMKKGHETRYHRHRTYGALQWELFETRGIHKRKLDAGAGINQLTAAISKNRVSGTNLVIEIKC
jgi:hypothetical protein